MGMILIDGGLGEGGGQVLRTALCLSAVSGRSFRITNIRKNRSRPGLLSQHLVCVEAAAAVCNGEVSGARKGSNEIEFLPGLIRGGSYVFQIPTAGSALLVFQTVFPALSLAGGESDLEISGGTHNPKAPPFEFIVRVFLPSVAELGFAAELQLHRHGFYPRGGGILKGRVFPLSSGGTLALMDRGTLKEMRPEVLVADLTGDIAAREARVLGRELKRSSLPAKIRRAPQGEGPGNAVLLEARYGEARVLFSAIGRKGLRADAVARKAVERWRCFHKLEVPVQPELADQLLLPMAIAGTGRFLAGKLTPHARTNVEIIEKFLDVRFHIEESRSGRTVVHLQSGEDPRPLKR